MVAVWVAGVAVEALVVEAVNVEIDGELVDAVALVVDTAAALAEEGAANLGEVGIVSSCCFAVAGTVILDGVEEEPAAIVDTWTLV